MFTTFPRSARSGSMLNALNLDQDVQVTFDTPGGFLRGQLLLGQPNPAGVFTVILLQKGDRTALRTRLTVQAQDLRRALEADWSVTALCIYQAGACLTVRDLVVIVPTRENLLAARHRLEAHFPRFKDELLDVHYWDVLVVLERALA